MTEGRKIHYFPVFAGYYGVTAGNKLKLKANNQTIISKPPGRRSLKYTSWKLDTWTDRRLLDCSSCNRTKIKLLLTSESVGGCIRSRQSMSEQLL